MTAFHILRTELGLHIPLELSSAGDASSATAAVAQEADAPVLVWGGSTSTGFYAIQVWPLALGRPLLPFLCSLTRLAPASLAHGRSSKPPASR